ncbi:hypothetical protein SELMODRAFT_403588 [Selaginella moellendorffii]|uniref:Bifunctional inhibitor/plant lipid transfer protein/seed storage helical domain-containing protein n=1 Tax=Selaginella moellendorffii TaxID=88036 RepID=D8QRW1_SELML|nr:putative lipid-transfer protein DIR1 [Selaginella moellendorffii]EFJ37328.1 hypothetical protein SELMODRAFT_403588 [Selaginella moellendorffii]|eukprot:XP_002962068.1 putative lipid-transfer protein DIR1 [Selaginella moellendorffii]
MALAKLALVVLFLAATVAIVSAAECKNNIADLLPCQAAAQSETSTPSTECCTAVGKFKDDPACLCSTIAAAQAAGFTIDAPVAATIPKRCKLDGYPTSCSKSK